MDTVEVHTPLLEVHELTVEFATRNGTVRAVEHVDLTLPKGSTLGIVGESGSGKSVTSYAVLRILDRAGHIARGSIRFSGIDLVHASEPDMQDIRGREISMIFQNPRAALNPVRSVGKQIEDVLLRHSQTTRAHAREAAIEALRLVRIARPEERYDAYPFQLSGGMCQRIVIAIALACQPQLLIADEPTTGLDVTTQKAVMDLIADLTRERHMSTILITHDLGLAATYCDHIMVMEKGRVVETATARQVFAAPAHPYTQRLMRATPRPGISVRDLLPEPGIAPVPRPEPAMLGMPPLLEVVDLVKEYPTAGSGAWFARLRGTAVEAKSFRAVNGIGFSLRAGESVGLVGESGCGKSTTSSMVMRLLDLTSGSIRLNGRDIGAVPAAQFAADPDRAKLQMVFQDATDSLNPRFTAFRSIVDPLYRLGNVSRGEAARAKAESLADMVGLPRPLLDRFPHQLSGGQKARVGIARAIALRPQLLILDEPTAALDVSVQAIVLNLLVELRASLGMAYLFVSHDLHVVRLLCDRVIVMRAGAIVEQGPTERVMSQPEHPYTRELLDALPHPPS
jgi:peptide/nickel transport system ATP-binding protein